MVFGRRGVTSQQTQAERPERPIDTPPPIPTRSSDRPIIVPQSAVDATDPYALVQSVVNFVNFALRRASFNRDEIAPNALRAYHADYYMAQVNNGGHGQYAGNGRMLAPMLTDVQEGLEAMRHPAAGVHAQFVEFSLDEPVRFRKVMEGGGFGDIDPRIEGFDRDFFAFNQRQPINVANRDWLQTLPELKAVPDIELEGRLQAYAGTNRQAAFREADRNDARLNSRANNALDQALTYLCIMTQPPRLFISTVAGVPGGNLGDGVDVIRFVVDTDKGRCSAFFHPKAAVLFDDTTKGQPPIAQVPIEMVLNYVKERTGKNLFAELPR